MRPEPADSPEIRSRGSRLLRAGIAAAAIGALVAGGSHASAHPSSAAQLAQPAVGAALPLEARDPGLSRAVQERVATPELLAEARTRVLDGFARELAQQQTTAALEARTKALKTAAARISEQSEFLKDQSSFLMPTAGGFDSRFGPRLHPILRRYKIHNGDDIGGACGQPIWAAANGKVIKADMGGYNGGSGNNVRVAVGKIGKHKVETAYLHMKSIAVKKGQKVTKGQLLGTVGSTGLSTACHLHFSVYEDGKAVAPKKYLGK